MTVNKAANGSKYYSLDAIYSFLNPSISPGGSGPPDPESLKEKPFSYVIKEVILDPKLNFVPWLPIETPPQQTTNQTGAAQTNTPAPPPALQQQGILNYAKHYFESNSSKSDGQAAEKLKERIAISYQAIAGGTQIVEGTNAILDLGNKDYWGDTCKSLGDIVPTLKDTKTPRNHKFTAMAFLSKDPYVSPATRGTSQIDFFLNYTPPLIAAQLIPFLDVEFQLVRSISGPEGGRATPSLSSPSIIRFLMGSRHLNDPLMSQIDKALELGSMHRVPGTNNFHNLSGMELFLMPQTLTNFGGGGDPGLYDLSNRLAKPKPFTPFASIESCDITVQNAGAGKFATRKANLKLKVHDKARLSEMSEFLKVGGQGYSGAYVWITYGWLAPKADNENNEYFRFINQQMMKRDCYKISNTSFTFDAKGQATLSIEMHSAPKKSAEDFYVKGNLGGDELKQKLSDMTRSMETVQNIVAKYQGNPKFRVTEAAQQVLNAGSGGSFASIGDTNVDTVITNLVAQLEKGNVVKKEDIDALKNSLSALKAGASGKGHVYTQALQAAGTSVKKQLTEMAKLPDPFLASDGNISSSSAPAGKGKGKAKQPANPPTVSLTERLKKYFNDDLVQEIAKYQSAANERNSKLAELAKAKNDNPVIAVPVESSSAVMSFGKLFLSFVVPAVRDHVGGKQCDELQIYFYSFNESCGPLSGHSIAEFPVNMAQFIQTYLEALKESGGESMKIEDFFSLLVNTQFVDQRAIGYGQNSFFKPWDPTKPNESEKLEKDKAAAVELGMNNWLLKYGELKIPVIEMYVELSNAGGSSSTVPLVEVLRSNSRKYDPTPLPQVKSDSGLIMKIHIYDRQASPYKASQQVLGAGDGSFKIGQLDEGAIKQKLREILVGKSEEQIKKIKEALNTSAGGTADEVAAAKYKAALEAAGIDPESAKKIEGVVLRGQSEQLNAIRDRYALKKHLMSTIPTLTIGSAGTLIQTVNAQSKTDGALGAMRIMNAMKGKTSPGVTMAADGLTTVGGLPIFVSPLQLTMTTVGVPTLELYQQFFVDFDTGMSIDNIYSVQQIQHTIAPGKFSSQITFTYQNGYAKFAAPQSTAAIVSGQLEDVTNQMIEKFPAPAKEDNKSNPKKKTK